MKKTLHSQKLQVPVDAVLLSADLTIPADAQSLILCPYCLGNDHSQKRNASVVRCLNEKGYATLLVDLLTDREEDEDRLVKELRFNIPLLSHRLLGVHDWVVNQEELSSLPIHLLGWSTSAAASIVAGTELRDSMRSIISMGGRPDLAGESLKRIEAPVLLLFGDADHGIIEVNERAFEELAFEKKMDRIEGAGHFFEEQGTLQKALKHISLWIQKMN